MIFKAPATTQGPAGITIELPQSGPLQLSLDDAIALGLNRNLRMVYDRATQREVKGEELGVINALLPSLTIKADTQAQEIDLAALGFKPSLLAGSKLLPPGFVLQEIVKVKPKSPQSNSSSTPPPTSSTEAPNAKKP